MNLQEAYRILGASPGEDPAQVKGKYRQLMLQHHPDAAGASGQDDLVALELAKQINEAFRLVKRQALQEALADRGNPEGSAAGTGTPSGKRSVRRRNILYVPQNRTALYVRSLYIANPLHEEMPPIWVAEGKFFWDPDVEDFRLFLMSVNRVCMERINEVESSRGFYSRDELPQPHLQDRVRRKLFHLLVQEYVNPRACLNRLCTDIRPGKDGFPEYHVEGAAAFSSRSRRPSAQEILPWTTVFVGQELSVKMEESRLLVYDGDYCFGHVFFDEDYWYYVVIPLVMQSVVRMKVTVKKKLGMEKLSAGGAILSLDLALAVGEKKYRIPSAALHKEMEALLDKYEKHL